MSGVTRRVATLVRRAVAAQKWGCHYLRSKGFRPPSMIRLNKTMVPLCLRDEPGITNAFKEIFLDDCYKLKSLQREDISTIVDVGGNIGLFSLAARGWFADAEIHCYEPNSSLGELVTNAATGEYKVFREAVGAESGFVGFNVGQQSIMGRTQSNCLGLTVPQVGFEEALSRIGGDCDLVKLDCEGAEWEILANPEPWRRVRFLTMEYHLWAGCYSTQNLIEILSRIGFSVDEVSETGCDFGLAFAHRT